jgi:hypothetical protein
VTAESARCVRNRRRALASLFGSFVLHESNPLIFLAASAAVAPRAASVGALHDEIRAPDPVASL